MIDRMPAPPGGAPLGPIRFDWGNTLTDLAAPFTITIQGARLLQVDNRAPTDREFSPDPLDVHAPLFLGLTDGSQVRLGPWVRLAEDPTDGATAPRRQEDPMSDPQAPGAVTGYRQHPQEVVDLVNEIKAKENELGELHARLAGRDDVDPRMLALGRTNLQQGFMWTVRALFQPDSKL